METQWLKVDQYTQIAVNEYNGKISMMQGNKGQNDVIYPVWCVPQKWSNGEKTILKKNGKPVFMPWSIKLGTKENEEKAAKILEELARRVRQL